jgi:signal transduction histidine kinase
MLHSLISEHRAEIVDRGLLELKRRYPNRQDDELIDGLPSFIDELVDALRRDAGIPVDGALPGTLGDTTARQHGLKRKNQGFDISRIVHDYGLVCDLVSEAAMNYGYNPDPREFQMVNRCVDEAIAMAVESFSNERMATEQRDKAETLGSLAHEIRNALGNAMMAFEMIRSGRAGANGRTADVLHRALTRIGTLVAGTLASAVETSGATAQREWLRLDSLLSQLVAETASERGIQVQLTVEENLAIDADSRLLVSAVSNLLQNAIKFTRDREIVQLRAQTVNGAVQIEIEDRCGGLPAGFSEKLFQPFVKGTEDRSGTGLGLAIARRAVEAHGGTISVRNVDAQGCLFEILIPRTIRILDSDAAQHG